MRTAVISPLPNGYRIMFYSESRVVGGESCFSKAEADRFANDWEILGYLPPSIYGQEVTPNE